MQQNYDMAIADYTQSIKLNNKYAAAYYNRGLAYERKSDYKKASIDYQKAVEFDPNNESYKKNLQNIRKRLGQ